MNLPGRRLRYAPLQERVLPASLPIRLASYLKSNNLGHRPIIYNLVGRDSPIIGVRDEIIGKGEWGSKRQTEVNTQVLANSISRKNALQAVGPPSMFNKTIAQEYYRFMEPSCPAIPST